jgi:hypothetical protein
MTMAALSWNLIVALPDFIVVIQAASGGSG